MAGAGKDGDRPVLIVKKRGHGEHGHHGGAWKVAYADFVTAMMAFFLLLWLLNVTSEEQKLEIANYFMPESVSKARSGGGGVLGGATIAPGDMERRAGGLAMAIPMAPDADESEVPPETDGDGRPPEAQDPDTPGTRVARPDHRGGAPAHQDVDGDTLLRAQRARQEEESFRKAEADLRQAIQDVPELKQLAENLVIDRTDEGLRIQIVDQGRFAMFPLGSAAPLEHTRKLLALVAQVVGKLPNQIAVTGHTDARPFQNNGRNYGNWELSTDRANASRRGLLDAGLPTTRINRVVGKAEHEPLFAADPLDPRNRRISIVLLRETRVASAR
jgi:chemotaxis protein MotB